MRPTRDATSLVAVPRRPRPFGANPVPFSILRLAPEEHSIRRVACLLDIVIPEAIEKTAEVGLIARGHLHADQHAPVVRPVIPVMKQADVPTGAHAVEKA